MPARPQRRAAALQTLATADDAQPTCATAGGACETDEGGAQPFCRYSARSHTLSLPPSLPPSCQHSFFEQCSTRRWQTRHHTTPHGTHTTTHGPLRDSATTAFKPVPSPKTVRQPPACCAAVVLSLSANVIRHRRCPPDPPPVALGAPPPGARVARARVARPELEHVNVLATARMSVGSGGFNFS